MSTGLSEFELRWLDRLNQGAQTLFETREIDGAGGLHSAIADAFVSRLGMKPIGFNWELLDPGAAPGTPRSALSELTSALSNDISSFGKPWLDEADARQCALDFLAGFDPSSLTVVSNRYDGLWNPISGAEIEWGFVAFDRQAIALMLIREA